jgi:hypothetical protein
MLGLFGRLVAPGVDGSRVVGGEEVALFPAIQVCAVDFFWRREPSRWRNAVIASADGSRRQFVVAGAGYAGLHVALRMTAKLRRTPKVELTLIDRHDYHQALTELPRVAGGAGATGIELAGELAEMLHEVASRHGLDARERLSPGPTTLNRSDGPREP